MNRKYLFWEMALCIAAGVLTGTFLAFHFQTNILLCGVIGGLFGGFSFRPREAWQLVREILNPTFHFLALHKKLIGMGLFAIITLALSLTFHYFWVSRLNKLLPNPPDSIWVPMIYLCYLPGIAFSLILWHSLDPNWIESDRPSWTMPLMSRIYSFRDKHNLFRLPKWHWKTFTLISLYIIFFFPLSAIAATVYLIVATIDLLLTLTMLFFFTPRLAIVLGALIGTLVGCIFCTQLWSAILLGSAIGIPVGFGFQCMRLALSSQKDFDWWMQTYVRA